MVLLSPQYDIGLLVVDVDLQELFEKSLQSFYVSYLVDFIIG
jgi:hypothetical protein